MDEVTSKNVMGDARGNKNSSEGSRGTSR